MAGASVSVMTFALGSAAYANEIVGASDTARTTITADETLTNAALTAGTVDFGTITLAGANALTGINIDESANISVASTSAAGVLTAGFADIASGATLTVIMGDTQEGNGGTANTENAVVTITNDLGEATQTTLVRGGTLEVKGSTNADAALKTNTLNVNGNTLLTAVTLTGGAAGALAAGGNSVIANFGNAASDTLNVTGFTLTGGAANATANGPGGLVTATVTAVATIGANGITIQGGLGADSAAGGNVTLTFANGATIGGAVSVIGDRKSVV